MPAFLLPPRAFKDGAFSALPPFGLGHVSDLGLVSLEEEGSGRMRVGRGKGLDRNNSSTRGWNSHLALPLVVVTCFLCTCHRVWCWAC